MKPVVKFDIERKSLLSLRLSTDTNGDGLYELHIGHVIVLDKCQTVEVYVKDKKK